MTVRIGTAGWSIPRDLAAQFPADGSSLERYAARFTAAEINSSFHRPHRPATWARWRDSVPDDFRFSVKVPKTMTHQAKLAGCETLMTDFLHQAHTLGPKLAVLLVQLPPKLEFVPDLARTFFMQLAAGTDASIACEPRHVSWFTMEADALLRELQVARVAADPSICEAAAAPGGWRGLDYWRLHGSPVIYRSSYADCMDAIAGKVAASQDAWCIFDNTASSAAAADALALLAALPVSAPCNPPPALSLAKDIRKE